MTHTKHPDPVDPNEINFEEVPASTESEIVGAVYSSPEPTIAELKESVELAMDEIEIPTEDTEVVNETTVEDNTPKKVKREPAKCSTRSRSICTINRS